MTCEKFGHGHYSGICWPCADEAGRRPGKLLHEAALVLDAITRASVVLCFCDDGYKTCDCGGDAVRRLLAELREAGIDPILSPTVRLPRGAQGAP